MKDFIQPAIFIVFGAIFGIALLFMFSSEKTGRYYDCSISEISPDYPIQVKEECRKIRRLINA
jgi:hypothetical protein